MECREYHKTLKCIKTNWKKCGNVIKFSNLCLEGPHNLKFRVKILCKKTLDETIELNIVHNLCINIGFKKHCLILLIFLRTIQHWYQPWIVIIIIAINLWLYFLLAFIRLLLLIFYWTFYNIVGMTWCTFSLRFHIYFYSISDIALVV